MASATATHLVSHHVARQQADPDSLLNHYRALLALRRAEPALRAGDLQLAQALGSTLAYWRVAGNERIAVLLNFDRAGASPLIEGARAHARSRRLWPAGGAEPQADAQARLPATLAAQSLLILKELP